MKMTFFDRLGMSLAGLNDIVDVGVAVIGGGRSHRSVFICEFSKATTGCLWKIADLPEDWGSKLTNAQRPERSQRPRLRTKHHDRFAIPARPSAKSYYTVDWRTCEYYRTCTENSKLLCCFVCRRRRRIDESSTAISSNRAVFP